MGFVLCQLGLGFHVCFCSETCRYGDVSCQISTHWKHFFGVLYFNMKFRNVLFGRDKDTFFFLFNSKIRRFLVWSCCGESFIFFETGCTFKTVQMKSVITALKQKQLSEKTCLVWGCFTTANTSSLKISFQPVVVKQLWKWQANEKWKILPSGEHPRNPPS